MSILSSLRINIDRNMFLEYFPEKQDALHQVQKLENNSSWIYMLIAYYKSITVLN